MWDFVWQHSRSQLSYIWISMYFAFPCAFEWNISTVKTFLIFVPDYENDMRESLYSPYKTSLGFFGEPNLAGHIFMQILSKFLTSSVTEYAPKWVLNRIYFRFFRLIHVVYWVRQTVAHLSTSFLVRFLINNASVPVVQHKNIVYSTLTTKILLLQVHHTCISLF